MLAGFTRISRTVVAAGALSLAHAPLQAQASPGWSDVPAIDKVIVQGSTGQGSKGATSVNIASGNNNQQLTSLAVANGTISSVSGAAAQSITSAGRSDPGGYVGIGQGIFNGASGAVSLNIAAGDANQQANVGLFAIGISGAAASDALLSQTRATTSQGQDAPKTASSNTAAVPSDAFGGSQGLVQINLTAGNRNSSANIFALTAAGGSS